jgi:hypothetical protein
VTAGAAQGEILSTNLFYLSTNDLLNSIQVDTDTLFLGDQKVKCLMYADDLLLCSLSPSGLQNSINLNIFCVSPYLYSARPFKGA